MAPPDDPTGGGAILVNGVNRVNAADAVEVEQADADFDVAARLDALTVVDWPAAEPLQDVAMPVVAAAAAGLRDRRGAVEAEPEVVAEAVVVEAEPEVVAEAVVVEAEPEVVAEAVVVEAEPEVVAEAVVVEAEPEVVAEAVVVEAEPEVVAEAVVVEAEPEVVAEAVVVEAEPEVVAEDHDAGKVAALAAAAALIADPTDTSTPPAAKPEGKPRGLFSRFKPGQNLDAELEAYEREQAAVAATAAIVADAGPVEAAVEPDSIADAAVEPAAVEPVAVIEPEAVPRPQPSSSPKPIS